MKKQAIARTVLRQLAARVELDRSLGVSHGRLRLAAPLNLSAAPGSPTSAMSPAPGTAHPATSATPAVPTTATPATSTPPATMATAATATAASEGSAPRQRHLQPGSADALGAAAGMALPPIDPDPATAGPAREALAQVAAEAGVCQKCRLCQTRRHVVFGEGDLAADLVFVGAAPGRDEDQQGRPFVGRAGQVLTAMIEKGMQRPRASVYICNIIKCRPPSNRNPLPDEVALCNAYLQHQLEAIRPRLIITLGPVAAMALTGLQLSMRSLRGNLYAFRGIPLLATYHPDYLLRQRTRENDRTEADRETWEDLKKALACLQQS